MWLTLDNLVQQGGSPISLQTTDGNVFDAIVYGEREPQRWMAGSNGFSRYRSLAGGKESDATDHVVHFALTYDFEGTIVAYRDGVAYGNSYHSGSLITFDHNTAQILVGMRHGTSASAGRMLAGVIMKARLYDRALGAAEVAASFANSPIVSRDSLIRSLSRSERNSYEALVRKRDQTRQRVREYPSHQVYAAVPKKSPGVSHLLNRGNPLQPIKAVAPGGVAAIRGVSAAFGLPADASDGSRRKALADWMTSSNNPLFARVIVNRLWHLHFGAGFVQTPNDFGFNGGYASHPQLLDWLATQLIQSGWSLKHLHYLIVTSGTYRQSSGINSAAIAQDGNNRLLWRYPRRRMAAEVIRDSVLRVSGRLNSTVGGAPFRDVRPFEHRGATFYEPLDPIGEEFCRRSIYRLWARGGRNALLDVFDCPDPSATAPNRAVTTTPLQALAMLNNSFMLRMSSALAERLQTDMGDSPTAQVDRLYELAYSREATNDERTVATEFIQQYGLSALCRVVLNTNEFLYVE